MVLQNEISNGSIWPRISLYWRNEKSRICIRKSPRLGDIWAPCIFFANGHLAAICVNTAAATRRSSRRSPSPGFSQSALVLNFRSNTRMDGSSYPLLKLGFFPRYERMSTRVSGGTVQFSIYMNPDSLHLSRQRAYPTEQSASSQSSLPSYHPRRRPWCASKNRNSRLQPDAVALIAELLIEAFPTGCNSLLPRIRTRWFQRSPVNRMLSLPAKDPVQEQNFVDWNRKNSLTGWKITASAIFGVWVNWAPTHEVIASIYMEGGGEGHTKAALRQGMNEFSHGSGMAGAISRNELALAQSSLPKLCNALY